MTSRTLKCHLEIFYGPLIAIISSVGLYNKTKTTCMTINGHVRTVMNITDTEYNVLYIANITGK